MATLLYRLGILTARRAKTVIAAWFAVLAVAVAAASSFSGTMSEDISLPEVETSRVTERLAAEFPEASGGSATAVVRTVDGSAFTDAQRSQLGSAVSALESLDPVREVTDPFATAEMAAKQWQQVEAARTTFEALPPEAVTPAEVAKIRRAERLLTLATDAPLVSEQGDVALLMIGFEVPLEDVTPEELTGITEALAQHAVDGVEILPGDGLITADSELFSTAEVVGLGVAAVVLLMMLGTLIGSGLPLLNALVGVGIAVAATFGLSGAVEMMSITPVLGVMLGLAVGIDYALFIIHRHRRQLMDGLPMVESVARANGTAGSAVVFAGATVIIALLSLNVTGLPFLGLMGSVAALAVAVAVLMATTMTPALLSMVGWRILRRRERTRIRTATNLPSTAETTEPDTRLGVRRALLQVIAAAGVLTILAIPATQLRLAFPDAGSQATGSTGFQAYVATENAFGQGMNGPMVVAADLPVDLDESATQDYQLRIAEVLAGRPDVATALPIALSDDRTMAAIQVIPADGPAAESTEQLVHDLRGSDALAGSDVADARLSVAGATAVEIDISEMITDALPLYLGLVVGLSIVLMTLALRSLLLPIVATVGFIGSLAAAMGVVVAVFQWGWFPEIVTIGRPGPIMTLLPVILIGILFGLAMDYQLFTASGMRESYALGAPGPLAIRHGLRAARRVVAAAALIMASVFAGFVSAPDPMVAPIGLGLAAGVLLDAFVVRLMLVPAVLTLLGPAAWWLPAWLDRLLPNVDVEGTALSRDLPKSAGGGS